MKNLIEQQIEILKGEIAEIEASMSKAYRGLEWIDFAPSKSTYEVFEYNMRALMTRREMKKEAIMNLVIVINIDEARNK